MLRLRCACILQLNYRQILIKCPLVQKDVSFYRFTVTVRVRVSVRISVRFTFIDTVGIGFPDVSGILRREPDV